MSFLILDTRERQRLELKALRTKEAYFKAPPGPVRDVIWHHLQAQMNQLLEDDQLKTQEISVLKLKIAHLNELSKQETNPGKRSVLRQERNSAFKRYQELTKPSFCKEVKVG